MIDHINIYLLIFYRFLNSIARRLSVILCAIRCFIAHQPIQVCLFWIAYYSRARESIFVNLLMTEVLLL